MQCHSKCSDPLNPAFKLDLIDIYNLYMDFPNIMKKLFLHNWQMKAIRQLMLYAYSISLNGAQLCTVNTEVESAQHIFHKTQRPHRL